MNTHRSDDLPHIEATLNYLAPMAETAAQLHLRSAARRAALEQHARGAQCADSRCARRRVGHLARPRGFRRP